jgi:hypothetical protein
MKVVNADDPVTDRRVIDADTGSPANAGLGLRSRNGGAGQDRIVVIDYATRISPPLLPSRSG